MRLQLDVIFEARNRTDHIRQLHRDLRVAIIRGKAAAPVHVAVNVYAERALDLFDGPARLDRHPITVRAGDLKTPLAQKSRNLGVAMATRCELIGELRGR